MKARILASALVVAAIPALGAPNAFAADPPSVIIVDYINAARTGDFSAAGEYWAPGKLREIEKNHGGMKAYWEQWKEWERDDQVAGAEVVKTDINEVQKKATVFFKVFCSDGRWWNCRADMYRTGGRWRIEGTEVVSPGSD